MRSKLANSISELERRVKSLEEREAQRVMTLLFARGWTLKEEPYEAFLARYAAFLEANPDVMREARRLRVLEHLAGVCDCC